MSFSVRFGDISHSLEFEIDHAYELTVYRVFGLSLVAGIIESIQVYIAFRENSLRKENLEEKLEQIQNKMMEKMQCAMGNSKPKPEFSLMNAMRQITAMNTLDLDGEDIS